MATPTRKHGMTGKRNAAKPAAQRRIVLPAQRIAPAAMAVITPERIRDYGGIGKLLDAALLALPSVERSFGIR